MAKFTLKNLFKLLGTSTKTDAAWIKSERAWFLSHIKANPVKPVLGRAPAFRVFSFKRSPVFMALAIVLVFVLSGGGVVAAAQNSLPDEPLYAIKLATEKVRVAATADVQIKTELRAKLASKRIEEIERVSLKKNLKARVRERAILRALKNYDGQLDGISSDSLSASGAPLELEASSSSTLTLKAKNVGIKTMGAAGDISLELGEENLTVLAEAATGESKQALIRARIKTKETREKIKKFKVELKKEREQMMINSEHRPLDRMPMSVTTTPGSVPKNVRIRADVEKAVPGEASATLKINAPAFNAAPIPTPLLKLRLRSK